MSDYTMNSMTEEEKQAFAGGVSSEGAANSEEAYVLSEAVETRCPACFMKAREGASYGSFAHSTYYSVTCGLERGVNVLLPPGYSEKKRYPVLYLLHGIFGNEYSFSQDPSNCLKEIVGNMAADGLIEETIVVCPNMFAATDSNMQPGFTAEACEPYDNFINDLTKDLIPYIEKSFAVKTGRENTYLAGFSMGGRETIYITLMRPELFGYVCSISAAPGILKTRDRFMEHPGVLTQEEMRFSKDAVIPERFLICCGSRDSVVGTYPMQYHNEFTANGTEHLWYEVPEADHDNQAIMSGIFNLLRCVALAK